MDSLTHTVLGACLGEVIAGKKIGKKAMLIGAIANNIPDIDVLSSLWMSQPDSLLAHRGFTHSFLFILLAVPLLSVFARYFLKTINLSFKEWCILIGSSLIIHIFIDAFTTYGTGWFEPFSQIRIAFNSLYIIDPVILLIPFISAIALLVLKVDHPKRKSWAGIALSLCCIYLMSAMAIKYIVNGIVKENISTQHILSDRYMTSPAPLTNLLWFIIIESGQGYYVGYYSLFDKHNFINLEYVMKNDSLSNNISDRKELLKLLRFSNGFYCYTNHGDTVLFNDMRFGQVKGWSQKQAPFVFRFNLNRSGSNDLVIQKGRMENLTKEAIAGLFKRIKGNPH